MTNDVPLNAIRKFLRQHPRLLVVFRGASGKTRLALLSNDFDEIIEYNEYLSESVQDDIFEASLDDNVWPRYLQDNAHLYVSGYMPVSGGDSSVLRLRRNSDRSVLISEHDVSSVTNNHYNWNARTVYWKNELAGAVLSDVITVFSASCGTVVHVSNASSLAEVGGTLKVYGDSDKALEDVDFCAT
jgi:hypothetical protein